MARKARKQCLPWLGRDLYLQLVGVRPTFSDSVISVAQEAFLLVCLMYRLSSSYAYIECALCIPVSLLDNADSSIERIRAEQKDEQTLGWRAILIFSSVMSAPHLLA